MLSVRPPGQEPLPPKPRKATGRPPKLRQRAPHHQPVSAQDLAVGLPLTAWQTILMAQRHEKDARIPFRGSYWLRNLAADTSLATLVATAKRRWIIERDSEERKQELGLRYYEGRGWRGFHHHATLCIAAYGFLIAERSRFSPSALAGQLQLALPEVPPDWKPRGAGTAP
jgi:SRSO17 transposase